MLKLQKLSHRIVLFLSVMLGAVTLGGFVVTQTAILNDARNNIAADLAVGQRVVERQLQQRNEQLILAARVLAADFAFREAIATHDRDTVMSALENHGRRIRADAMMMIGLDGNISAATPDRGLVGTRAAFADRLRGSTSTRPVSTTLIMNGRLHQLVVVPVLAPVTIGYVAMAFEVGDAMARDLAELTGMAVSFFDRAASGAWQALGSSHDRRTGSPPTPQAANEQDRLIVPLGAHDSAAPGPVFMLEKSLQAALKPFNQMRLLSGVVGFACMMLTILGILIITRSVTRPLQALTTVARQIGEGDYSIVAPVERNDEVGTMAVALNAMREGIAQREQHISALAYRDGLTGLPNRLAFCDSLTAALAGLRSAGASVSVLLLNLDRFKQVNDAIGHAMGDALLRLVAARLREALAQTDVVLACFGGDEFAVLLYGTDCVATAGWATRLTQLLEAPVNLNGQLIDVSASIGYASAPEHATDSATLIRCADAAMQTAKRLRAGALVYEPRYDQGVARLSMLTELRQAVDQDELTVWYQPKLDLASGRITGVEALVRWEHPRRGFIRPDEFIPYAEQTGYIREITKWVFGRACRQIAQWRRAGLDLHLSVNLSARDLLRPDLPEFITSVLQAESLAPEQLTLEITESAIMDDPTHSLRMLEVLNAMGLTLAVDDFGTGYSSLAYLKSLPVSKLKIDKSFVLRLTADSDDAVIVRSTIDLAHSMKLKVVAEGVETLDALNLLRGWGCDQVQGYFIGKPMAVGAFEQWLKIYSRPADQSRIEAA